MKKKMWPIVLMLTVIVVLTIGSWFYYNYTIQITGVSQITKGHEYGKHYVLISEDAKTVFWQTVYESAKEAAKEKDAYVQLMGTDAADNYTTEDYMNICIASKVDGIILDAADTVQMEALISDARDNGIPVVTVLKDLPQSQRLSFVGVNNYQLGQIYGEQILAQIEKDTEESDGADKEDQQEKDAKNILVLLHGEETETNQNLLFSQLKTTVSAGVTSSEDIQINAKNITTQGIFDSEETIRNIVMDESTCPDILVCLDEADTERAYQILVDYNKVGEVAIIGYYISDTILSAIEKENIAATVVLDASQLGTYSVDALDENAMAGRVSDYFSVDLHVLTKENVEQFKTLNDQEEES